MIITVLSLLCHCVMSCLCSWFGMAMRGPNISQMHCGATSKALSFCCRTTSRNGCCSGLKPAWRLLSPWSHHAFDNLDCQDWLNLIDQNTRGQRWGCREWLWEVLGGEIGKVGMGGNIASHRKGAAIHPCIAVKPMTLAMLEYRSFKLGWPLSLLVLRQITSHKASDD